MPEQDPRQEEPTSGSNGPKTLADLVRELGSSEFAKNLTADALTRLAETSRDDINRLMREIQPPQGLVDQLNDLQTTAAAGGLAERLREMGQLEMPALTMPRLEEEIYLSPEFQAVDLMAGVRTDLQAVTQILKAGSEQTVIQAAMARQSADALDQMLIATKAGQDASDRATHKLTVATGVLVVLTIVLTLATIGLVVLEVLRTK